MLDSVVVGVKLETLVEVFASKAANNHDRVTCELGGAEALASDHLKCVALGVAELNFLPGSGHVSETKADLEALN